MARTKVIFFVDWFFPAFKAGGPIKSVLNLALFLEDTHDILIVCSNQDIDGTIVCNKTNSIEVIKGLEVMYLNSNQQTFSNLTKTIQNFAPDFIHVNSLFSKNFTVKVLIISKKLVISAVVAPRGMLTKEALKIKPIKKEIFIFLARLFLNPSKVTFHASTKQEENQIKQKFQSYFKIKIAQNLSAIPVRRNYQIGAWGKNEIRLVYIARIAPIKNLYWLLNLFGRVNNSNIYLDIFGPKEDSGYWEECNEMIRVDNRITYKGVLEPQEVIPTLGKYHFFILPSKNENFGHSIVESISSGIPVIISDRTPWLNLKKNNIGFDIPLENESLWVRCLENLDTLTYEESKYEGMVNSCFEYSNKYILNEDIKHQNLSLFDTK